MRPNPFTRFVHHDEARGEMPKSGATRATGATPQPSDSFERLLPVAPPVAPIARHGATVQRPEVQPEPSVAPVALAPGNGATGLGCGVCESDQDVSGAVAPVAPVAPEIEALPQQGVAQSAPPQIEWDDDDWATDPLPAIEQAEAEYQRRRQMGYSAAEAQRLAYGAAVDDWLRANWPTPTTGQCAGCGGTLGPPDNLHLTDGARLHTADDNACLIAYGRKRHLAAAEALAGLGINPPQGWLEEWEISK